MEELKNKAISNGNVLFDALTEHTLATVGKTGLPYFLLTEKEQYGASFGERFLNAVKFVFDKGFESVITVGNDTPHLTTKDILRAARSVSPKKFILGPSTDGGFYLMGLHKSQFHEVDFTDVPWQTSSLFKTITRLIEVQDFQVIRFHVLQDLDDPSDLKKVLNAFRSGSKKIIQLIISLLAPIKRTIYNQCIFLIINFYNRHFNKGSPLRTPLLS
jgi:glycosyltransferase A (GT-A) superfamily protein (DUF2064 family)